MTPDESKQEARRIVEKRLSVLARAVEQGVYRKDRPMSDEAMKPLARCMGGRFCTHRRGTCTATNEAYQAKIDTRPTPSAPDAMVEAMARAMYDARPHRAMSPALAEAMGTEIGAVLTYDQVIAGGGNHNGLLRLAQAAATVIAKAWAAKDAELSEMRAEIEALRGALPEVFKHGHAEGWTGNQLRRDTQMVDADKGWSLYVSNGGLAKTIARAALGSAEG